MYGRICSILKRIINIREPESMSIDAPLYWDVWVEREKWFHLPALKTFQDWDQMDCNDNFFENKMCGCKKKVLQTLNNEKDM